VTGATGATIGALAGISAADAICVNAIVQVAIAAMATRFMITPQINAQHYISVRVRQKRAYAEPHKIFPRCCTPNTVDSLANGLKRRHWDKSFRTMASMHRSLLIMLLAIGAVGVVAALLEIFTTLARH